MPSGSFRPSLTMVFKSEPSGFDVRMRPAERSKKYKRATVFAASSAVSDLEALEDDIESFIPFSVAFIYERRFGRSALIWLDESAEAGNGLAENQVLHLEGALDRKSTRLNSSHLGISYAVFCLKKKRFLG